MDMNEEEAGAHLIATAAPDHWRDIVLGYWIVTKNREAITECERRFETSQKPIPCTVLIRNPPSE
jgi:hypothetical protein